MTAPAIIDLRSDTVTRPTPRMREAMATCKVGDDVFGDDPTVIELEKVAAEMVGTEASLWCPTGTMANQVAIATHTRPGQEIIAGTGSHIVNYELAGLAWNSLCQLWVVSDEGGWPDPEVVVAAMKEETMHTPGTGLVCMENTHNRRGGRVMPMEILTACAKAAHARDIPVHLDGARIWNASAASGIPVRDYTSEVDSLMFCLSKGLGSPAGSMLCGKIDFIARARRMRKRMGGALRQVGVLAACGLVSLSDNIKRLADDHRSAKELVNSELAELLHIDPDTVETNICIFTLPPDISGLGTEFSNAAFDQGLQVIHMGKNVLRMVTHYDFDPEWIGDVVERTRKAIEQIR